MVKRISIFLLFSCILGLRGQIQSTDLLTAEYKHGLNTDDWLAWMNIDKMITPRANIQLREQLSSSRIKVTHDEDKWKDQHQLNVLMHYHLSNLWLIDLFGNQLILEDHQSGYENDITTQMVGAGNTLSNQRFRIPFMIGMKQDARFRQKDNGWTSSLSFQMPRLYAHEYTHQVMARYDQDNLNKRRNRDLNLRYQVFRQFYRDTCDSLKVYYSNFRRDYYISPEGEIESRQEHISEAENRLTYGLSEHMQFHMLGRIGLRELNISLIEDSASTPKRNRRDLETTGIFQLAWTTDAMNGRLEYRVRGEDQKYEISKTLPSSPWSGSNLLLTPNNHSNFSALALLIQYRMGYSDSVYFNVRYQKFKYDTPDDSNYDDRDEIRYNIDLSHQHKFNRELMCRTDLDLHLHHLIYIFGQKSADNNWTRMIRLKPSVIWQPNQGLRWKQSAEVLANYVDYDFDSELPGIRSFIYRKFQLEDSCSVRLFPQTNLHVFYRLELDENGKLIWDDWLQQRLIDRQSHTIQILMEFTPWPKFTILPGYSIYMKRGFQYYSGSEGIQEKKLNLDFKSEGPILKFSYTGRKLNFSFSSHTIRTKTLNAGKQIYTRLDFYMRWLL